jgi:transposase
MRNRNLEYGIMSMDRIREVLRLKEQGYSQRDIHRSTGISRSCIQRYLGKAAACALSFSEASTQSNDELRERLERKIPGRQRASILDPDFRSVDQEYRSRKGVTLELLWLEWGETREQVYSYQTFCRRYREWCGEQKLVMRGEYEPGDRMCSDYAGETLSFYDNENKEHKAQIFVSTLAASNLIYAEASADQKILSWCGSHTRSFEYFGGTPKLLVIDNLRSGVTRSCRYEPELNRTFEEFGKHHQLAILPARVAKPRDKAKVEEAVQVVERWVLAPLRKQRFSSIAQLNEAIAEKLSALNAREMKQYQCSRRELFERTEKAALRALPATRFIPAVWKKVRVHLDYHVQVEKHWYSVPYWLARKEVFVRVTETIIEVFYNNERVASHLRSIREHRHSTVPAHLPPQHLAIKSRSAENFLSWSETVGTETQRLVQRILDEAEHPEQAFRSILGLQRLAKQFTPARLECAAAEANQAKIASQRFVRSIIEKNLRWESQEQEEAPPLLHENIRGSSYYH